MWGYVPVGATVNDEVVPYFEDANSSNTSGHATGKTPDITSSSSGEDS